MRARARKRIFQEAQNIQSIMNLPQPQSQVGPTHQLSSAVNGTASEIESGDGTNAMQSHFIYQLSYGKSSSVWRRCRNLKFSLSQLSTLERREQWGEVFPSTCYCICTNPALPRGALACHEND
uniref:Uncharacterized protein n=1 Tax=Aureoumbra lagunensis TaxID=44058 RepID=A0A7S3K2G7_9STRA